MSAARRSKPAVEELVPALVYLALVTYLVGSSLFIRLTMTTRVGYAVAAASATIVPVALMLLGRPAPPRVRRIVWIAVACSGLYVIPAAILPQGRTLEHVIVDFTTTIVPLGFLLLGAAVPATFRRILGSRWVLLLLLVTLSAPFIVIDVAWARSFEPPDVGVIALLAVVAVSRPVERIGRTAAVGSFLLVALAGFSGSRSIFMIAILAFLVTMFANRTARMLVALGVVAALALAVVRLDVVADLRAGIPTRASARIINLMWPGNVDLSTGRLNEAGLLLEDMQRRSPVWMVIGMGHGAVFEPASWHQPRTISEEGFVHNIHIGPLLMLFRYGVAGLILFLAVSLHAAWTTFRLLRRGPANVDATALLYAFGTCLFVLEFGVRNVLPNPLFSFFLAGHLAMTIADDAASAGGLPSPSAGEEDDILEAP